MAQGKAATPELEAARRAKITGRPRTSTSHGSGLLCYNQRSQRRVGTYSAPDFDEPCQPCRDANTAKQMRQQKKPGTYAFDQANRIGDVGDRARAYIQQRDADHPARAYLRQHARSAAANSGVTPGMSTLDIINKLVDADVC